MGHSGVVIGAILNYIVWPVANPLLLFGGILPICAAIAANAMAYRELSKGAKAATKGIVLRLVIRTVKARKRLVSLLAMRAHLAIYNI